jgi:RNA polymerase sigma-70 factor (ECF subfamily)
MSTLMVTDPVQSLASEEFDRIYREYAPLVYRTAWGVLGRREDAEDVLQSIFLKLLRREFSPALQKNPKAYLYRAAINLSLDILKAQRRRPLLIEEADGVDKRMWAADSEIDEDLCQRLYDAIGRLGPEAAEVILLHYMQKKKVAEIAKALGISRTHVAVRLFRARTRLRKLLQQEKNDETR